MDPYSILGVSRDASMDDVKKAYRKKARENHPDLNPDDPKAEERMNQVNEAYDRIMNPEKYAASDARKRGYSGRGGGQGAAWGGAGAGGAGAGGPGGGYYNPFAGWGSAGSGGAGGRGASGQPGGGTNEQGNPYVWTTIDFDSIFGGGWGTQQVPIHPEAIPSDPPEVRQAINNINANNFKDAIYIMQQVPSTGRNARWYYILALANNGAGNTVAAHDNIGKARQLDPNNLDYQRAENQFKNRAQTYTQKGQERGFTMSGIDPNMLCCCICLAPSICSCLSRMYMYGGFWNG